MSTSDLAAAILDLSLPVKQDSIVGITVGLPYPENIGLAAGIKLLLCVQLEFPHEEVVTQFTNENGTPSDFSPLVPVCPDKTDVDINMNSTVFETSNYR